MFVLSIEGARGARRTLLGRAADVGAAGFGLAETSTGPPIDRAEDAMRRSRTAEVIGADRPWGHLPADTSVGACVRKHRERRIMAYRCGYGALLVRRFTPAPHKGRRAVRLSTKSVTKSCLFAGHGELPHTGSRAVVFSREPGNGLSV